MGEYVGIKNNFTNEYTFHGALINIDKQMNTMKQVVHKNWRESVRNSGE
jgi:hypothetical protein